MTIPLRPSNASKRSVGMSSPSHALPQHTPREPSPVKSSSRRTEPVKSKTITISKNPMRGNQHKASWTPEQDAILLKLLQENGGTGRWRIVAERFQSETGVVGRGAKHCRERYFNHLDPNINHSEWTEDEDAILTAAYAEHGTAWSKIAKFLPGRTDNAIKNRWYCKQRKQSRKARSSSSSSSCSSSPRGTARIRSTIAEATAQMEMMTSSDESCSERKCRKRPIASTTGNRPRSMTCNEDDQREEEEPLTVKRLSMDETDDSPHRQRQSSVDQKQDDDDDDDADCTSNSSEQEDLNNEDNDIETNDYYSPRLPSSSTTVLSRPDSFLFFTQQQQQQQSLQRPDSFLSSLSFPAAFTTTSSSKTLGASFYWNKPSSSSLNGHPSVESTELAGRRSPLEVQSSTMERFPSLYRPASLVTMLGPSVSSYDLHLLLDTISFNDQ